MTTIMKLGALLAILLSSILTNAQSQSDKIYDMFSGKEGVTSLSFSKSAMEPFELFLDENTKKVMYKMKKIRFLSYNESKGELQSENVYNRIEKELSGNDYFQIEGKDLKSEKCEYDWENDEDIRFIGKGSRSNMDEFHAVIHENENCILVSFYGQITVADLKGCSDFTCTTKSVLIP